MVRVCLAIRPAGQPGAGLTLRQARAALYNWLYARRHGGALVLRIEDAGVHVVPGAMPSLCADLRWLGLDWDEGPGVGGAYGPYVQTLRLDVYRRHARSGTARRTAMPCSTRTGSPRFSWRAWSTIARWPSPTSSERPKGRPT
jgi:glutamyl-tRNA synthetase